MQSAVSVNDEAQKVLSQFQFILLALFVKRTERRMTKFVIEVLVVFATQLTQGDFASSNI
jgi:hypothetical protein